MRIALIGATRNVGAHLRRVRPSWSQRHYHARSSRANFSRGCLARAWGKPIRRGTAVAMTDSKTVVPRSSPGPRVRQHGVQVQVRCHKQMLDALDAARELEKYKPSRPEMLRRLAWQVLRERGLLKIPG